MRRLAFLLLVASSVSAQDAPEARSILFVPSREEPPASVVRIPDDSLDARRWRTVASFLGSTGGYVVLGATGALVGFELDCSGCDDVWLPDGMFVGWAVGSALGAGLGAHLGGGRSGSLPWALAASGVVQAGLWLYSTEGRPFAVLVPVSVLAATIADRVSASGRAD